jgi:phytoene dehydrogenase-like protein
LFNVMISAEKNIIIIGAGLAGLSAAHELSKRHLPFLILEAQQQIGGRLKTELVGGFKLNNGFQVLQTAYPEARRLLEFDRLQLNYFAPGAIVRVQGKFYRISDPLRRPGDLWQTLRAPIGSLSDRFRIMRLASNVRKTSVSTIFSSPDMATIDYLRSEGFSEKMIRRFFRPFFAGVSLDPDIAASSRVFRYIYRVFAEGDVAIPNDGMQAIAQQISEDLPQERIRTGARVASIADREVVLVDGERLEARTIIIATEGPETFRLLGLDAPVASRGEWCLYFSAKTPPISDPFLILNGEGSGWVNSVTVPSVVAPSYAPAGRHLVSVVVVGYLHENQATIEKRVRRELSDWFGTEVAKWDLIQTQRITHALPDQPPPMPDPMNRAARVKPGIYVCGEYQSVPGIQWALLSGYQAAQQIIEDIDRSAV